MTTLTRPDDSLPASASAARRHGRRPGGELRVLHEPPAVDLWAAERAAGDFLTALGVDVTDESLRETPRRMAAAYVEMFTPRPFDLTTFPNDEAYDELVVARGLPVTAVCEHHLLPFVGVAHVGYLPGPPDPRPVQAGPGRRDVRAPPAGAGAAHPAGRRLARRRARPRGVGVVIEAEHLCMTMRGVRAGGASTVTSALHGRLRDDPATRSEFFALAAGPAPVPA